MVASPEWEQRENVKGAVLSVIMPNYNHSAFLSRSLSAILAQSRQPDEIVLIDDCSTDQSREVIQSWVGRDSRIRVIFNSTNIGAIASINLGVRAAKGDLVVLMAADDVCSAGFFQAAVSALADHRSVGLFCAEAKIRHVDDAGRKSEVRPAFLPSFRARAFSPSETKKLHLRNDNFLIPLTAMYRRALVLAEGGFDPRLGSLADGFLTRKLALKHGFYFYPHIVATWFVRRSSLSQTTAASSDAIHNLLKIGRDEIEADPDYPEFYGTLFERRLRFSVCRVALAESSPDWDFVRSVGLRSNTDRVLANAVVKTLPRIAPVLVLVWLTLRLRPYSLISLVLTAVGRKMRRAANEVE